MTLKKPTGPELRALREQHKLTQVQLAALVHAHMRRNESGSLLSSSVQKWEKGTNPIPAPSWELLEAKLLLLRQELCSFEELTTQPLHTLIAQVLRRPRKR